MALSVVDDEQVSEAAQPVCEYHTPRCDRPHLLPRRRPNEQSLPRGPAAGTLGTEAVCEHTPDRQPRPRLEPRQAPFSTVGLGNSFVAKEGRGRDHPAELLDEPRQARLVTLEVLHLAALGAQLAGDVRKHFAVLLLLFDERGALGAPRRFDDGDLGVPFPGPGLELFQPDEAGTQLADELGLGAGNIAAEMPLTPDPSGFPAREQEFQSALLSIEITQGEQSPEAFP